MNWDGLDFVAAAVLVGGGAGAYMIVTRMITDKRLRVLAGLGVITIVALIWVQLAVGII